MIDEINTTQLEPVDVLSGHAYYYSKEDGLTCKYSFPF